MSELPDTPEKPSTPSTSEQSNETRPSAPPPEPHTTSADPRHKATQFNGNPNPQGVEDSPSTLKPRDDTPAVLKKKQESRPDAGRTVGNHPADPNALTTKMSLLPPGIEPDEAIDPGRETPDAPPVDDRSGTQE